MVKIIFPLQILTNLFSPSVLFQIVLHLCLLHSTCLFWHLENEPHLKKKKNSWQWMNVCETSSLIFLGLCNSKSAQHLPTSYL